MTPRSHLVSTAIFAFALVSGCAWREVGSLPAQFDAQHVLPLDRSTVLIAGQHDPFRGPRPGPDPSEEVKDAALAAVIYRFDYRFDGSSQQPREVYRGPGFIASLDGIGQTVWAVAGVSFPTKPNQPVKDPVRRLLHSTDGGETFTEHRSGPGPSFNRPSVIDDAELWLFSYRDCVVFSLDAGQTFSRAEVSCSVVGLENRVVAVGEARFVLGQGIWVRPAPTDAWKQLSEVTVRASSRDGTFVDSPEEGRHRLGRLVAPDRIEWIGDLPFSERPQRLYVEGRDHIGIIGNETKPSGLFMDQALYVSRDGGRHFSRRGIDIAGGPKVLGPDGSGFWADYRHRIQSLRRAW
jgi:hypothetical protein